MTAMTDSELWFHWLEDVRRLGLPLSEEDLARFQTFYQAVLDTNRHTNLTRITALPDFLERHLLDSLWFAHAIPQGAALADVGSGAGFPVIPLLLARPDITAVGIESVGKKTRFMAEAAQALGLSDRFQALNARSEDLARLPAHRDRYDVVTARAVAALPTLAELCLPLVRPDGCLIALKSVQAADAEITQAKKALSVLKGRIEARHVPIVASLNHTCGIEIRKTGPTPQAYPRKPGTAGKTPL